MLWALRSLSAAPLRLQPLLSWPASLVRRCESPPISFSARAAFTPAIMMLSPLLRQRIPSWHNHFLFLCFALCSHSPVRFQPMLAGG